MIEVRTCARLHLGLLDNNGGQGRLYGSIGVAVAAPALVLRAEAAGDLQVEGLEARRATEYARRFMRRYGAPEGARITLEDCIPPHVGLGSGTQLGIAVGSALARIAGLRLSVPEIALAVGRGLHSGIGIATFQHGGFVLDGGHPVRPGGPPPQRTDEESVPPLLFKHPVPADWHFVLAIPSIGPGISGEKEKGAFQHLPVAPEELVREISWVLLMKMLPALVEKDIANFGRALTRIQCMVGDCFAPAQGGRFAAPQLEKLVEFLLAGGAAGAGQSSWGPAVYGVVEGRGAAQTLAREAQAYLGKLGGGRVTCVRARNRGASIREIG